MPATCIVVPCFNERARLDECAYLQFIENASDMSVLFVDDGSTDDTMYVLERLSLQHDRIRAVRLPVNVGKGEAVREGLSIALAEDFAAVGYLDADLATPLDEMGRLCAALFASGADAVLGSRVGLMGYDIERSVRRHYAGRVFATVASLVLGRSVYDTQCGAKVFRGSPQLRRAVAAPFRTRWAFDVELLQRLISDKSGLHVIEQPLLRWSEMPGSKLRASTVLRIGFELLYIACSRRLRLTDGSVEA